MHGQLLALHVEREALGALAQLRRRALDAFGEEVADPLALADHVDQRDDRVGIAPREVEATRHLLRDDAVLVALHRERAHGASRDRVEHVLRVQLVDERQRVEIAHAAERAGRGQGLVFGPTELRRDAELLHLHLALARHRARVARATVDQDRVAHLLAADVLGALERAVAEVAGGQDAAGLQCEHAAGRAELVEAVGGAIVMLLEEDQLLLRAVLVGGRGRLAAAHDDRLQLLGAHDRAQAAAPVEMLQLVHDGGVAHEVLTRHPALQRAHALVTQLHLDAVLHLARELAPVRRRITEFDLVVLDPQVHRRLGRAVDDDAVPTRRAQLRSPPAARLRLAIAAGQRRLRRRRVAVRSREREPVDHTRREHEHVVRPERLGARLHVAQQDVRGERAAAEVLAIRRLGNLLRAGRAARQVDVQDPGGDRHGWLLPRKVPPILLPGRVRRPPAGATVRRGSARRLTQAT